MTPAWLVTCGRGQCLVDKRALGGLAAHEPGVGQVRLGVHVDDEADDPLAASRRTDASTLDCQSDVAVATVAADTIIRVERASASRQFIEVLTISVVRDYVDVKADGHRR